jgi:hypothetical protein
VKTAASASEIGDALQDHPADVDDDGGEFLVYGLVAVLLLGAASMRVGQPIHVVSVNGINRP